MPPPELLERAPPASVGTLVLETLRAHCEGRLTSYKLPRRLEFIDKIPRTAATNQIQRPLIVEWIQSK